MAFSIESRVPYLDQEFVDHILSLPGGRHRAPRLEPLDPARRAQGHAAGEDPPAPLEGRVHHAGDALDQGAPCGVHEPVPVADVPGASVLGRRGRGAGVPRLLQGPGGGEHVLLARRQRRAVAARVRRPQRGARGRRRGGGARRARPRRPCPPRQPSPSRATRACRRCWRRPRARRAPPRPPRPSASSPGSRPTTRSTCSRVASGTVYARLPLRTDLVARGDDLDLVMRPARRPARQAGRPGRHGREAHRRQPGTQLRARRDPPDEAGQGPQQGRHQDAARHRARHPRDHAAGHRRGRRAAHRRRRGRLGGRQGRRQARPLLQGGRRRRGGHRRPHLEHAAAAQHARQARARPTRTASPRTSRTC